MIINNDLNLTLQKVRIYQIDLLESFPKRKDTILQLVEALACAEKPSSPVELSLTRAFQRTYSNISNAIDAMTPQLGKGKRSESEASCIQTKGEEQPTPASSFQQQTRKWTHIFARFLPKETYRPFKLFAIDTTSVPRPHAQTLDDRSFVHQVAQIGSPITIGLQASVLVAIPEKVEGEASWTLPLSVERIPSIETPCETAERQLKELEKLSPKGGLCIHKPLEGYLCFWPSRACRCRKD
jgi:hypothetical protein